MYATVFKAGILLCFAYYFADGQFVRDGPKCDEITIAENGIDSQACLSNRSIACGTLGYVLRNCRLNNTCVKIRNGTYTVNEKLTFDDIKNLTITGDTLDVRPTITCAGANNSGLFFRQCHNISLTYFEIHNCGFEFESSSCVNGSAVYAFTSVFMVNSEDVRLDRIRISNSTGIGAVFYDVVGNVTFDNVTIEDCVGGADIIDPVTRTNKSTEKRHSFFTGGGIYIEFRPSVLVQSSPGEYLIRNSDFKRNLAHDLRNDLISESDGKQYFSLGRGGGLSFISRGKKKMNHITVESCHFHHNRALWGAGIFAEIDDKSGGNSVTVIDSDFLHNIAVYGGGGMRIGFQSNNHMGYNKMKLKGVAFKHNSAVVGGAFSQYRATTKGSNQEATYFDNCIFEDNNASTASSIHVQHLNITFKDVRIHYSPQRSKLLNEAKRQGSFYCYSSHVTLEGTNVVLGANYTAYLLDYCLLVVRGVANFTGNRGINGGAIALFGHAKIRLTSGSRLFLHHNEAKGKGGAMFVQAPVPLPISSNSTQLNVYKCFFVFGDTEDEFKHANSINTTIDFFANKALSRGGDNIWATTIEWCRGENEPRFNNTALKWKIMKSNGKWVSMNASVVTSPAFIITKANDWNAHPGIPIDAQIIFRDENWNEVNATVCIRVFGNDDVVISNSDIDFAENGIAKTILKGTPTSVYSIELKTMDSYSKTKTIEKRRLLHCPPGFYFREKSVSCACLSISQGVTYCEQRTKAVYIIPSRWGNVHMKNSEFASHVCPMHYCNRCNDTGIGCRFNQRNQCAKNRDQTSVLCGKCKKGYSVVVGAETCAIITGYKGIGWIFLSGFLLTIFVVLIMAVNLDTYSTSLNAFFYSYQIIPMLIANEKKLDDFVSLLMSLTNVSGSGKLQEGFKFWDGMTDMLKLALNYFIPVYLIACTAVVGALSTCFSRCWFSKKSTFRAFVFISVIAYADFTKITFKILTPIHINGAYYAYYAAHMPYFGRDHAPYASIAVICLITVVIGFPLTLLFPNYITRQPRFVKLKGVFDTFQEPFQSKPYYNTFASFYFINRLVLLTMHTAFPAGPVRDVCFSITCVISLIVFILCQPYKEKKRNLFDGLQLTNIVFMAIMFTAVSVAFEDNLRKGLNETIWAFSYVPLFCICYNAVTWLVKKVRHYKDNKVIANRSERGSVAVPQRLFDDWDREESDTPYTEYSEDDRKFQ